MSNFDLRAHSQLVRFFEKQAEWIGLAKNAGPILAALYVAKYEPGEKISLEDLSDLTRYSRSNVSLILTQLEALGIVYGEIDHSQTGRGRRRILYEIDERFTSLISLVVKTTILRLKETLSDIESLRKMEEHGLKRINEMLDDFQNEAEASLPSFLQSKLHETRL
ncbi:hypothetical protein EU527_05975 [Candidatus Thorarchaeota archaeon]|nr:MAG: hypothetical protein EU527_05975 [Candidatus Thorarchaeota archaeon]